MAWHRGRNIQRTKNGYAVSIDLCTRLCVGTVATRRRGQINDDRSRTHAVHRFFRQHERGLAPRYLCSGNDYVRLGRALRHYVAAKLERFWTQLLGVTAGVLCFNSAQIHRSEEHTSELQS